LDVYYNIVKMHGPMNVKNQIIVNDRSMDLTWRL